MVSTEKVFVLIEKLLEKTIDGKIEWEDRRNIKCFTTSIKATWLTVFFVRREEGDTKIPKISMSTGAFSAFGFDNEELCNTTEDINKQALLPQLVKAIKKSMADNAEKLVASTIDTIATM